MAVGSEVPTARWARLTAALRLLQRTCAPRLRLLLDRLGLAKESLLRRVPQRFQAITDEIAKFGMVGLINLGVNFAVFNALFFAVSGSNVKAKAIATVVAATSAYFLNRYWTYRHRPKRTLRREYSLFFLFNAVGLLIETAIMALAMYGLDQTSWLVLNICTFVGIGLGTVFRFWAYRTHVFKLAPEPATTAPVPTPGVRTVEPRVADDDLHDELVQLELDEMLHADDPVRR